MKSNIETVPVVMPHVKMEGVQIYRTQDIAKLLDKEKQQPPAKVSRGGDYLPIQIYTFHVDEDERIIDGVKQGQKNLKKTNLQQTTTSAQKQDQQKKKQKDIWEKQDDTEQNDEEENNNDEQQYNQDDDDDDEERQQQEIEKIKKKIDKQQKKFEQNNEIEQNDDEQLDEIDESDNQIQESDSIQKDESRQLDNENSDFVNSSIQSGQQILFKQSKNASETDSNFSYSKKKYQSNTANLMESMLEDL